MADVYVVRPGLGGTIGRSHFGFCRWVIPRLSCIEREHGIGPRAIVVPVQAARHDSQKSLGRRRSHPIKPCIMGKPARSDMPQILFSNFPGAWFEAWVELDEGLKGTRRRTSGYELGDVIEPDIIPPVKTRVYWRRSHGGTRRLHSERSQHAFIPPFIRSLSPLTSLLIPLPPTRSLYT
ncbi:hypothetical protein FA13DRAFT_1517078 [Coprinellus micaceus]|uniref:Uncharacterized protein n=1 Tax=Coprinellus micaceus TaxID=71717 RepID=A0A4Y7SK93_COPMI|nr:hypothetical protein FA13DRAFT_1517078 [Coprinellus micaceus]